VSYALFQSRRASRRTTRRRKIPYESLNCSPRPHRAWPASPHIRARAGLKARMSHGEEALEKTLGQEGHHRLDGSAARDVQRIRSTDRANHGPQGRLPEGYRIRHSDDSILHQSRGGRPVAYAPAGTRTGEAHPAASRGRAQASVGGKMNTTCTITFAWRARVVTEWIKTTARVARSARLRLARLAPVIRVRG
jgi:hypothetical protein